MAEEHYQRIEPETGELYNVEPEYATMSRRPGLGRGWIERWYSDVYPSDEVITRGRATKPPRFYDLYAETQDPQGMDGIRQRRRRELDRANSTEERLSVRKQVTEARTNLYSPRKGVD